MGHCASKIPGGGLTPVTYHFIVSIGTSLLTKYEEYYRCASVLGDISGRDFSEFFSSNELMSAQDVKAAVLALANLDFASTHYQGAEQKSVSKALAARGIDISKVHFHLLATRTGEGAVCAAILKEIWKTAFRVDVHFPEGFGRADDAAFAASGLPNLLSEIAQIMEKIDLERKAGCQVEAVIIPTGGYKAIIPYLTIAGILYGCPAYYIYEDSNVLIELPAPPLGINISVFRAAFSLLENVAGAEGELASPYLEELSPEFRKLVHLDATSGKYVYTAFGKRLREMYTESKGGDLVVKASRNRLIARLPDCYRDEFKKLVQIGAAIWLGDKAPEMADHARYHHLNLFTYAELLLLPLFWQRAGFLTQAELLLLLGMIYLHDCGHTLTELEISSTNHEFIPLLHSEIRNFHNLLGYYRIKSQDFQDSLNRQGVNLSTDFFDAVAEASVYHRKKMPLLKNAYSGPDGKTRKALSELKLRYDQVSIAGDRCALVGALFRIIDGMDKQIARAGDVQEIVMKAESILAELPFLWRRASRLGDCLHSLSPDLKAMADESLKTMLGEYMSKESPAGSGAVALKPCVGWGCSGFPCPTESPKGGPENAIYQQEGIRLEKRGQGRSLFPLFWEYMTARSRFSFLAMQPNFYYTDVLLATPRISHQPDGDKTVFAIDYTASEGMGILECRERLEALWHEIAARLDQILPESEPERGLIGLKLQSAENIVAGVRDEYCSKKSTEVAQILNKYGIVVLCRYNDGAVPCWR